MPLLRRIKPATCRSTTRRELGVDFGSRLQIASVGGGTRPFDLGAQPSVVFLRFLLLLDVVPHEVAQELSTRSIIGLRRSRELSFQDNINPKRKGCVTHSDTLFVAGYVHRSTFVSRLR